MISGVFLKLAILSSHILFIRVFTILSFFAELYANSKYNHSFNLQFYVYNFG